MYNTDELLSLYFTGHKPTKYNNYIVSLSYLCSLRWSGKSKKTDL